MQKKTLRKNAMQYLRELSNEERHRIEASQWKRVESVKEWKDARTIAITVSKPPEWTTAPFLEKGWEEGKKVAVPKVSPSLKSMEFYIVESYDQLMEGYSGIKEPNPVKCSEIHKSNIDLLFVPGLLFNYQGYRIGFGGGFYDRYLEDFQGRTMSITSEAQLKQTIPIETHDIPVQSIITENRIINV